MSESDSEILFSEEGEEAAAAAYESDFGDADFEYNVDLADGAGTEESDIENDSIREGNCSGEESGVDDAKSSGQG